MLETLTPAIAAASIILPIVGGFWATWFTWRQTALIRRPVDGSTPYGAFPGEPAEYL